MVYAFMRDLALTTRLTTSRVEVVNDPITAVGYFDDKMANYFTNPGSIRDIRALRIPVLGVAPYTPAIPGMTLNFDVDHAFNDADPVTPLDFNDADTAQLDKIFNICDLVYLSQGLTKEDLDVLLIAGAPYTSIYQPGSCLLSTDVVESSDIMLDTGLLGDPINVHSWIEFTVALTTLGAVTFHVWLGKDAFEEEYPISTITKILFPCDPAKLLSPNDESVVHAIANASDYIADMLPDEITNRDHTGTVASAQTYYNATYLGQSTVEMIFEVFYKGMIPTPTECREAIVSAIADLIIGGGHGTLPSWQAIFPSLYVSQEWFLIPLWDNTTTEPPAGLVIYSGISSYSAYEAAITGLFPARGADIPGKIELLKAASCELLIAAFPGVDNTITSLVDADYAQYQTEPGPANELSADLTDFTIKLNEALAYIQSNTEVHTSVTEPIDGHVYESFTVGGITFHVLTIEGV